MSQEFEMLENRIQRLESHNRRLRWALILFGVFAMASAAWAQQTGGLALKAQKFELRDDAGRLRAELSMLNGEPALRFFDEHENAGSLLDEDSFTVFKKGGGEGDILASFASNGLSFEDAHDRQFIVIRVDDENQTGTLQMNDYRHKIYVGVRPGDLSKLHQDNAR